jgi:hypothetical protein
MTRPIRLLTRIFVSIALTGAIGCARLATPSRIELAVEHRSMADWNHAVRHASPAWKGADCAASVSLDSSRTLWLFGDTWIAPPSAHNRKGGHLIRNSIALQTLQREGPGPFEFYWNRASPTESTLGDRPFFDDPVPGVGMWPLNGIRVGDSLCLFMVDVVHADTPLGFNLTGNRLLLVSNPDDPPANWRIAGHAIPYFQSTPTGQRAFGSAAIRIYEKGDDFVYLLGYSEDWSRGIGGRDAILARVTTQGLVEPEFGSWEFYDGTGWTPSPDDARALFNGAATEMSIYHVPARQRYVAVYTRYGLSREILARSAPRPEGPWSEPSLLYRCPEGRFRRRYFCYAAKAHPELSRAADTVVVTYAVNSIRLADHFRDSDLYWPRFIEIHVHPES